MTPSRRALLGAVGGGIAAGLFGRAAVAQTMAFHLTTAEAGLILRFEPDVGPAVIDAVTEDRRVVWRGAAGGPTIKNFRLRPGLHALAIGPQAGQIVLSGGAYGVVWIDRGPDGGLVPTKRMDNVRPEQLAATKALTFLYGAKPIEDGSQPTNLQSMGAGVGLLVRAA